MDSTLTNKVALVTGGARGIGAAIVKRLAKEGAHVAFTYARDEVAATALVRDVEGAGGKAFALQADAADPRATQTAVARVVEKLGRIDILVNNAGTAIPKPFIETSLEDMNRVVDINLLGVMTTTQAALAHMANGGRIVNIGSCVGERVLTPGLTAYAATKAAVRLFTQGLAREVGSRGITVNDVQPGPIDTDLNPASGEWAKPQLAVTALGRYGTPAEVAALVAFVVGPEAGFITGANLTIDGGTNA